MTDAKVTLVATVKDAAGEVGEFLASVAAQTRPPDEVVICDGGSTDGTVDALRAADGVVLLEETGANIARGRNLAIRAATLHVRLRRVENLAAHRDIARAMTTRWISLVPS